MTMSCIENGEWNADIPVCSRKYLQNFQPNKNFRLKIDQIENFFI